MVAIVVVVLAVPVGLLVRNRLLALLVWGFIAVHAFVVQSALIVMEWVNGSTLAIAQSDSTSLIGVAAPYFVVTTGVELVGFGLVLGAGTFAARRRARSAATVPVAEPSR